MAMTLITTNTSSDAASSSFTSGIDSTYKLYIFKFLDINPATNTTDFLFNGSVDSGSNYNVTKTTTYFGAQFAEVGDGSGLLYKAAYDLDSSIAYQQLIRDIGNLADESGAGTLWLFNPSNTTYVKHFYATTNGYYSGDYTMNAFVGGYFNTTDNIDAIDFKMSSGNMDAVISMYGVG
jgi:hypothetical protein